MSQYCVASDNAVIMAQQNSAFLWFSVIFLHDRDTENESWFAFWISNLKENCFTGYVGFRTQVSLSRETRKIMFEERWQPHIHTMGLAQPFCCFCYRTTTEEQNFSANGSCCFCLSGDGSFREVKNKPYCRMINNL